MPAVGNGIRLHKTQLKIESIAYLTMAMKQRISGGKDPRERKFLIDRFTCAKSTIVIIWPNHRTTGCWVNPIPSLDFHAGICIEFLAITGIVGPFIPSDALDWSGMREKMPEWRVMPLPGMWNKWSAGSVAILSTNSIRNGKLDSML